MKPIELDKLTEVVIRKVCLDNTTEFMLFIAKEDNITLLCEVIHRNGITKCFRKS